MLGAKRLELLHQLVPKAATIAMLMGPESATTLQERKDVQVAAQAIGLQLVFIDVRNQRDIETPLRRSSSAGLVRCSSAAARF